MSRPTRANILEHGLIAVVDTPVEAKLLSWATAVAKGGIRMLGIPVWLRNVTEITSDLADEAGISVGITGLTTPDQVSIALAAGAEFVMSVMCDEEIVRTCKERGLVVIAGGATPTEIARALRAGADLVTVFPVGVMGGVGYLQALVRQFPDTPLLASGGVDVENAPSFLEAGAAAAIVDRGVFPEPNEPAAVEVITARAIALTEVCAEVLETTKRHSLSEILGSGSR
jgi:2-dehydro-3-deoxyphosphogluconate aldolase/(4S)-4-hydroxy-2-oxoglutarate aldolase